MDLCDRLLRNRSWLAVVLVLGLGQQATAEAIGNYDTRLQNVHPLDSALSIAQNSLQHSRANVDDYTATLVKRLRIDGQLTSHQFISVKVRNRKTSDGRVTTPMSVYLKFMKPASVRGREVIWVERRNRGRLVAHEAGFKNLVRFNLSPIGGLAMRGQRYPISDIGMENLAVKLIEGAERDRAYGTCDVQVINDARIDNRTCTLVQVVHPVQRPHYDFYRARVFFDEELNLPIRYASWSWPTDKDGEPVLEEEYTYTNVQLNVGLTDRDFDPDNTEYNYP